MADSRVHSFHIPVLGLAFSVDTPIRVARYGISSVISIVDDILIEHMRKHYAKMYEETYHPITVRDEDYRARRITAYLNLLHKIVQKQIASLKTSAFEKGSEIVKYFEMLPEESQLKALYHCMIHATDTEKQSALQHELRTNIIAGDIDVNIMTKLDKVNIGRNQEKLPVEFSDALASLRGFAQSDLNGSVVLSAGLNSRLFSYLGQRKEFIPDEQGSLTKRVILKVTDYRSAYIQGKILAKKGIWISEFRIESGLNCGGHAFASDGYLLGPILEEFKTNRQMLFDELSLLYSTALRDKGLSVPSVPMQFRITVQGGIGTAKEDMFLREYYRVDGTGWGSPFLLVPEATNVDKTTRDILARAKKEDYYISDASPLGIPFNNVHGSSSDLQIQRRVDEGKPGSRCTKKFLVSNTEFTTEAICTASSQYQDLKIEQLKKQNLSPEVLEQKIVKVVEKACLCEDLAASGLINSNGHGPAKERAVAVCPGPNLAYFSKIASLEEMVGHIYGRIQLLTDPDNRPNLFINELRLYVDYMKAELQKRIDTWNANEQKYFSTYKKNLQDGINHYKGLIPKLLEESERYRETMRNELLELERELIEIVIPVIEIPVLVY